MPASILANDLLLIFISWNTGNTDGTAQNGWSTITEQTNPGAGRLMILMKTAVGNEDSTSVQPVNLSTADTTRWVTVAISAGTYNSVDAIGEVSFTTIDASSSATCTAIVLGTAALYMMAAVSFANSRTHTAGTSPLTKLNENGAAMRISLWTATAAGAGSTGAKTITGSGNDDWAGFMLEIKSKITHEATASPAGAGSLSATGVWVATTPASLAGSSRIGAQGYMPDKMSDFIAKFAGDMGAVHHWRFNAAHANGMGADEHGNHLSFAGSPGFAGGFAAGGDNAGWDQNAVQGTYWYLPSTVDVKTLNFSGRGPWTIVFVGHAYDDERAGQHWLMMRWPGGYGVYVDTQTWDDIACFRATADHSLNTYIGSGNAVDTAGPHIIMFVFDGDNMRCYNNGVLTWANQASNFEAGGHSTDLYFGRRSDMDRAEDYVTADYDDIIVFQRAFNQDDATKLYRALVSHRGAASPAGNASISAPGIRLATPGAALSGNASLAVEGVLVLSGDATLSGNGSVLANGAALFLSPAASLEGVASILGAGSKVEVGGATLVGEGALLASGVRLATPGAVLVGDASLGAVGQGVYVAAATLQGDGTIVATGAKVWVSAAALQGDGVLFALGGNLQAGLALLSGNGQLIALWTHYDMRSNLSERGRYTVKVGDLNRTDMQFRENLRPSVITVKDTQDGSDTKTVRVEKDEAHISIKVER